MVNHYSAENIAAMEQRFKVNFVNSLSGYKSANLVGSVDDKGISNLCIVSSVVHLGSEPALMGFILRPTSARRDSYENMKQNKCFTLNHVHQEIALAAHYSSARFESDESEFKYLGLNEEYLEDFAAPFVKESHVKIALSFEEEHLLSNDCRLIIGKIQHVFVDQEMVEESGSLNLELKKTLTVSGLDKYHTAKHFKTFPYAKRKDVDELFSEDRHDNVVFNRQTGEYDAAIKKYATNLGAPTIEVTDLSNWKKQGGHKVNKFLETKYHEIKNEYEETLNIYNWNKRIYDISFNFEPIVGMVYHLYKGNKGNEILSDISPEQWNREHLGSFQLNVDRIFIKID